jgi:cation:H+ antiporter
MDFLYVGLGLFILILAGDALVKGAVNLSLRVGIPALIVSLTIVAFGTSAPELIISINAVRSGLPGLALGNVIGSNTANILLVLGVPALLVGLHTEHCETRRSYRQMIAATGLFVVLCFMGPIGLVHGLILLAALAYMLSDAFRAALAHKALETEDDVEGADPDLSWAKIALFLVLGMVGLPLGADILVDASTSIARAYGITEEIIGLTLVALGTSLPELATTVMAAYRRQADVALGNVIGSNMFNLLAIIGVTTFFGQIPVPVEFLQSDLWVMTAASLLLIPFVYFRRNLTRAAGAALTTLYILYIVSLFH